MPANQNPARHHVSFPPPPSLGLAASHEGQEVSTASEHQRTDGHPNAATSGVGYSKEQRPSLTPGRLECVAKPGQKQYGM